MHRTNGAYKNKKDKRALVLFALGAIILAGDWFSPALLLPHNNSSRFLSNENQALPLVFTTVRGRIIGTGLFYEISEQMSCAEISPRLALFFDLPVPLNRADYITLTMLPGIGRKRAENILRFRDRQGRITDAGMLAGVDGISRKLSERLESMLCFN